MAVKIDANFRQLNQALSALKDEPTLEKGIDVASTVLGLLGELELRAANEVVDGGLLKLPNSERQDPWFHQHPWMRGERSAFELLDSNLMPVQAKFYWPQKSGNSFVAGAVHFTKNWEDHDFTRSDEFKIGIDFFLTPDATSVLVVLSNRGMLRVLELSERLTNTQLEILQTWEQARGVTNKELLHNTLWESFKLQSVNTKFYDGISNAFNELLAHLKVIGKDEEDSKLFASRLLGRLIFIWFLRKMKIVSEESDYFFAEGIEQDVYYKEHLERLFFGTLNTPMDDRAPLANGSLDIQTPYLNGGLFSPREDDWVGDNNLTFPPSFFIRLFAHFDEFNFTTDESTPEYEQVAIDPEMLGRVFESLLASQVEATGAQARKAKGAFYTPREVVAYMCRESIRAFLEEATDADERLKQAISKLIDTSDQDWTLAGTNSLRDIPVDIRDLISSKLVELRTLDPACGSGAFPLGLLHLLSKIQLRLDPRLDPYKLKLSILQNNIFGVDIEPMAVEISRLRSWLSLVVEERGSKAIQPLPNLEFNFVTANSLLPLEGQTLLFEEQLVSQIAELRQQYFEATTPLKKKKLQETYMSLLEPSLLDSFDERVAQLKSFNPFDSHSVANFFEAEHMFGVSSGFDLVIGNPPYLGEKGNIETFKPVKNSSLGQRFYIGKMDYFYFFFHAGLDLLKEGGILAFITTNYFLTATTANKLRSDLSTRSSPRLLLNFSEFKIFESAAGQHNLVTILTRSSEKSSAKTMIVKNASISKSREDMFRGIFNDSSDYAEVQTIAADEIFSNNQIRLTGSSSHEIESVLDLVAGAKQNLSVHFNAMTGARTGADKVSKAHIRKFNLPESLLGDGIFVLSKDEFENLPLNSEELELIKPWFKNSDIKRYIANLENDEVVIFADKRRFVMENFPALSEHLAQFEAVVLGANPDGPYIVRPRSINFDGPKIVTPFRTPEVRFAYVEVPWYASSDVYFISNKTEDISLWSLLGILNSSLLNAWYWNRGKRKGSLIEMYEEPLSSTPLPMPTSQNKLLLAQIGSLAEEISTLSVTGESSDRISALDSQLDSLVCALYGLGPQQERTLQEWTNAWRFERSSDREFTDAEVSP